MKKFLTIIAVGAIVTACNTGTDTAAATADSIRMADSARMADSLANSMMMDTTTMPMDSTAH